MNLSVQTLFGFMKTDLIGNSLYDYFDARDFAELNTFFKTCKCKLCKFLFWKFSFQVLLLLFAFYSYPLEC